MLIYVRDLFSRQWYFGLSPLQAMDEHMPCGPLNIANGPSCALKLSTGPMFAFCHIKSSRGPSVICIETVCGIHEHMQFQRIGGILGHLWSAMPYDIGSSSGH